LAIDYDYSDPSDNKWYKQRYGSGRNITKSGSGASGISAAARQAERDTSGARRRDEDSVFAPGTGGGGSVGGMPGVDQGNLGLTPIGGMPENWYGVRDRGVDDPMGQTRFIPGQMGDQYSPQYFEGEQFDPGGWTTERIAKLQRDLVTAGLLTESFSMGVWDGASISAYYNLLAASNVSGQEWGDQLKEFKTMTPEETYEAFRVPKILLPDMDEIKVGVEEHFAQKLGREPTDGEMQELAKRIMGRYRDAREQDIDLARQEWEEADRDSNMTDAERQLFGDPGDAFGSEVGAHDVGHDINPVAEFQRTFKRRYEDEMDIVADRKQGLENTMGLQEGFARLRAMIGNLSG
jgi:hypothetical protein